MLGLCVAAVLEDRSVLRQQPSSECNDFRGTAAVFAELEFTNDAEVVDEGEEDFGIRAGPRVDRLFVVADSEDVLVVPGERVNHHVLHGIQVLEFVDEHSVPATSHLISDFLYAHQLGGLEHEHVEIQEVAPREEIAISLVENSIVVLKLVAAKAMTGESCKHLAMPATVAFDAAKYAKLIIFVGDSVARLKSYLSSKFAEQFGAEGVNCPTLDSLCVGAEVLFETRGNLAGGFVGEGKSVDASRVEAALLYEKANAFDEAVGLSCTGPRQHEQRLGIGLDCSAL